MPQLHPTQTQAWHLLSLLAAACHNLRKRRRLLESDYRVLALRLQAAATPPPSRLRQSVEHRSAETKVKEHKTTLRCLSLQICGQHTEIWDHAPWITWSDRFVDKILGFPTKPQTPFWGNTRLPRCTSMLYNELDRGNRNGSSLNRYLSTPFLQSLPLRHRKPSSTDILCKTADQYFSGS